MKMVKNTLVGLFLLYCIMLFTVANASTEYIYDMAPNQDNAIIITGYSGNQARLEIPSQIDGYTVVGIAEYAIGDNETIEHVVFPETLEYTDWTVFGYCPNLQTITIPATTNRIANPLCYMTPRLEAYIVHDDNPVYVSVDGVLFDKQGSGLLLYPQGKQDFQYEIPAGVCYIAGGAFPFTTDFLTELLIPDSIASIEDVFDGCTSLQSIGVSPDNQYYSSNHGVLFDKSGTKLLAYPAGKTDENYNVPSGTEILGTSAFYTRTKLKSIVIPPSVKEIWNHAFSTCINLETVTLSEGLIEIGTLAFENCYELKTINIPDTVTKIGSLSFTCCRNLEELVLSSNVTEIGEDAFSNCEKLTVLVPPGSYAEEYCRANNIKHQINTAAKEPSSKEKAEPFKFGNGANTKKQSTEQAAGFNLTRGEISTKLQYIFQQFPAWLKMKDIPDSLDNFPLTPVNSKLIIPKIQVSYSGDRSIVEMLQKSEDDAKIIWYQVDLNRGGEQEDLILLPEDEQKGFDHDKMVPAFSNEKPDSIVGLSLWGYLWGNPSEDYGYATLRIYLGKTDENSFNTDQYTFDIDDNWYIDINIYRGNQLAYQYSSVTRPFYQNKVSIDIIYNYQMIKFEYDNYGSLSGYSRT